MAQSVFVQVGENLNKTPRIDKFEFCQWKTRMRVFMMTGDMRAWFMAKSGLGILSNDGKYMMQIKPMPRPSVFSMKV